MKHSDFGQKMQVSLMVFVLISVMLMIFCGPVWAMEDQEIHLVFYKGGSPVGVAAPLPGLLEKAGLSAAKPLYASQVKAIVQAIVQGPSEVQKAQGFQSLLPPGTQVVSTEVENSSVTVRLAMEREFLESGMDDVFADEVIRVFAFPVEQLGRPFSLSLLARPADDPAAPFKRIPEYLPPPPPQKDKPAAPGAVETDSPMDEARQTLGGQPPARGQGQPTGALTGASIFVSPGHGWYYNSTVLHRWATQRGNTNNIIEDLSNGEACLNWLVKYLWNAGARVYTCRERDLQTHMVIIDDASAGYSTTGSWSSASLTGAYNGALDQTTTVTGAPTATATFTPNIPADGYYAVYVWYRAAGTGTTTSDARFTINHIGGSTVWTQNENRDGWTWKYVGTYYFEAGSNPSTGSVVVDNQSSTAGNYVVADAVRFGGGMGDMLDPNDPVPQNVSGEPRWEESGRYYRVFMGDNTWAGTVWAMPQYADWECEDSWEGNGGVTPHNNAIYVSWHTNAPDPGTGTSAYAYASGGYDQPFDGVTGSLELRGYIHDELINDIRAGWDAGWTDRGEHTNWFGEVNPSNNDDMPASLHEIAFHDTPGDAQQLRDPRFRQLTARAFYQGIMKFFYNYFYLSEGNSEFNDDTLLPEPPTHFRATLNGTGGIDLAWDAPPYNTGDDLLGDAATGYRVYRSTHPKGFADGVAVVSASYTDTAGLVDGTVYYYRVAATNSGGESFPTETLAVRCQSSGTNPILIVSGFDRLDRFCMIVEDDPYSTADLHREYLERMNSYDYVTVAAQAIETYGQSFDACSNESVQDGDVSLGSYPAVVWLDGEESSLDDTFSLTEQGLVQTYLNSGGQLFVSGAEIAWDLDYLDNGRSFYNNYLKADYAGDDAATYSAQGSAGIFSALGTITFDNGDFIYDVDWPDQINAYGGSSVNMTYVGGGGGNAGIQYDGTFKVVNLGFPFETIVSSSDRQDVMDAVLDFFGFGSGVSRWELY